MIGIAGHMKTAEILAQKPHDALKLVIPEQAADRHLADLTEWFCGFGFDRAEAEWKSIAWMRGEE